MFKYFLRIDRVDLADVRKLNSAYLELENRQRIDLSRVDLSRVYVVYGPRNSRTDKLINKLLEKSHARRQRQNVTHGLRDKYTDYEHILQATYRDKTIKMPSNKLIDSLLKDPNDRGGPDGDEVHNHTNNKYVATTPSHDDRYPDRGE
ncbi:hypothetical protein MTO96_030655 [Rhipicephalus appendiculatus]